MPMRLCGLTDSATRLLIAAARANYCPAEDLDRHPILRRLRKTPSFSATGVSAHIRLWSYGRDGATTV